MPMTLVEGIRLNEDNLIKMVNTGRNTGADGVFTKTHAEKWLLENGIENVRGLKQLSQHAHREGDQLVFATIYRFRPGILREARSKFGARSRVTMTVISRTPSLTETVKERVYTHEFRFKHAGYELTQADFFKRLQKASEAVSIF